MTNSTTPLTAADLQEQLAPFSHLAYLTGVRVPQLFSPDLILELSVEIFGEAVEMLPEDEAPDFENDGLNFTLDEAEEIMDEDEAGDHYPALEFPVQRWDILARGVSAKEFEVGFDVRLSLSDEARPLQQTRMPQVALMFAASPASRAALLASLFEVHDTETWGEFGKYGLGGDLNFGAGVFAEGPAPLMEQYAPVLEAHGMRPSFMHVPQDEQGPPPALCLLLDEEGKSFVLADAFEVIRRAELDTTPPETQE